MSQSLSLLCPPGVGPLDVLAFHDGEKSVDPPGRPPFFQARGEINGTRWYVTIKDIYDQEAVLDEYGTGDFTNEEFCASVADLHPLVIIFNSLEAVRDLIVRFLQAQQDKARLFWLDTEYGWVLRGDRLLDRVALDPEYDWRIHFDPETDVDPGTGPWAPAAASALDSES